MKRLPVILGLLAVLVAVIAIVATKHGITTQNSAARPAKTTESTHAANTATPKNEEKTNADATAPGGKYDVAQTSKPARPELSPEVAPDANPMAASVAEALKTGQHPERLSPLVTPKPFDQAAFEKDPAAYCAVFEPGRVFQTMKATGPDSVHLKKMTPPWVTTKQGDPVVITVKSAPRSPVTIISADGGYFRESHLNGITVQADDKGVASATYVADAGTTGNVRILAGSPMAVGLQNFVVDVNP